MTHGQSTMESLYDSTKVMGRLVTSSPCANCARLGREWQRAFRHNDLDAMIDIARAAVFLRSQYGFSFYLFANGAAFTVREMLEFVSIIVTGLHTPWQRPWAPMSRASLSDLDLTDLRRVQE